MAIIIALDQIQHLAPNVRSSYRDAFQNGQAVLDQCGISETPLRVAHFMAQVLHESGGLAIQIESLNYSAERLPQVWRTRFKPVGTRRTTPTTSRSSGTRSMAAGWATPGRTTGSRTVDE